MRNPVINDLKKNKLISKKNLKILSSEVRNKKNIKVYLDKQTKIIFLEKFLTGNNHFSRQNTYKNKNVFNLKIYGKKKKLIRLNDDLRRKKQFEKLTKDKILCDFGCGDGLFVKSIKNSKFKFALDINPKNAVYFKNKNIKFVKNLSEIKLKLDIVTLFHSLHYIPNQIQILKKIKQKIKKDGLIVIEVPHAKDFLLQNKITQEFKKFSFHVENLIWHTKESLYKFLKCAGYKNIKISYFQRYDINNHLNWMIYGNNSKTQNFIKNKKLKELYKKKIIENCQSDTLIAIAKN